MTVRMRHTSSQSKNRRSHHALQNRVVLKDEEGKNLRLPHRIDESTGMYRGKQIVPQKEVKAKIKDHEKRLETHKEEHEEGVREPVHAEKQGSVEIRDHAKNTGLIGRLTKGKAKARSGMGGTAS